MATLPLLMIYGNARALPVFPIAPMHVALSSIFFARPLWSNPAILDAFESKTPLRRIGGVDDVGGVAAFLATEAARYVTGQALIVDGGALLTGLI